MKLSSTFRVATPILEFGPFKSIQHIQHIQPYSTSFFPLLFECTIGQLKSIVQFTGLSHAEQRSQIQSLGTASIHRRSCVPAMESQLDTVCTDMISICTDETRSTPPWGFCTNIRHVRWCPMLLILHFQCIYLHLLTIQKALESSGVPCPLLGACFM